MKKVFLIPVVAGLLLIQSCNRNEDPPGAAVKASFSISGFELPSPTTITFINTSQNATAYTWSFGDGSNSTEFNPTHTYNRSAFSYLAEKCTGTPVAFSFKTINPLSTNTVWDFGNGIINVSRDPIIQFVLPGDYTIKYSSQINGVRDTVTRIIQIF